MTTRHVDVLLGLVFGLVAVAALCLQYGAYLFSGSEVPFSATWRSDSALQVARQLMAVGADAEAKRRLRQAVDENPHNQSAVERLIVGQDCSKCAPEPKMLHILSRLGWHDSNSQILLLQGDEAENDYASEARRLIMLLRFNPEDKDVLDALAVLEDQPAAQVEVVKGLLRHPEWRRPYFGKFAPSDNRMVRNRLLVAKTLSALNDPPSPAEMAGLINAIAQKYDTQAYALWRELVKTAARNGFFGGFGHLLPDAEYWPVSIFDWNKQTDPQIEIYASMELREIVLHIAWGGSGERMLMWKTVPRPATGQSVHVALENSSAVPVARRLHLSMVCPVVRVDLPIMSTMDKVIMFNSHFASSLPCAFPKLVISGYSTGNNEQIDISAIVIK